MSLNRYTNIDEINSNNNGINGEVFTSKELNNLQNSLFVPKFTKLGQDLSQLVNEAHIYTFNGDYITSTYDTKLILESQPESPYSIYFDVRDVFKTANITRGSYKVAFNILSPVYGRINNNGNYPIFVKDISPDRTEVQISLKQADKLFDFNSFKEYAAGLSSNNLLNILVLNFGSNKINKVINFRIDINDPFSVYFKLHTPIDDSVELLDQVWICVEIIDSYIDSFVLATNPESEIFNKLKGPKFDLDVDGYSSQATIYKSWEDLLTSDAPTTQRILDDLLTGSSQATLNIDYTDWKNFIFYSSAEERLRNFHYKMELIESYSIDNKTLGATSGSGSQYVVGNIGSNTNKINSLLESFDNFERWVYYSPTGSIFSHDVTGSLTPWPKYESGSKFVMHNSTSSIVENWYNYNLTTAEEYDQSNYNSLWWSIPEHILMDENNSQYQLFVQMIGQHFDNMYLYIKALTQIHERDEHPDRGPSNDLLFYIAKSFGWNLQNARQLSDLWLYKLGTDETGSFQDSSNMRISPHEQQTKQIWRRIVNNLPYLLKTKGTSRSIKALMSIYGIPQSLISIKEYGGPGLDNDLPILIEDTYSYKLNIQSGSYVKIPQDYVTAYSYGWGNGSWCGITGSGQQSNRTPDTYEFRFSCDVSSSVSATPILFQTSGSGNLIQSALSLVSKLELDSTESYSGSNVYGKVLFETFGSNPQYAYSDYLPLFDGDLWTVRIYDNNIHDTASKSNILHIARASDSLYGRIAQESVVSMSVDNYQVTNNFLGGAHDSFYTYLTNNTQTAHNFTSSYFSGSIQAYKEYFTIYNDNTFYNHVKNPRAYNTDNLSGSFYSLYRYIPFGIDVQRENHQILNLISSSQPDRDKTPSLIQYIGFTGSQYTQYSSLNETYYSEMPQIAGSTLRSEKIRLEDSVLKFELSPQARAEESEYNDKPNDTNRLAIVFSTSDQINREIGNHMGSANLDDWIADPENEFGISYPLLNAKKQEYFQKYENKYDINSFIRILSVYDYTFFEQIKQLVPARANLIAGILIEPHMLERNKVQISRLPEVTNPQWDDTITYPLTQTAQYVTYQDSFSITGSSDIDYSYFTSSIDLNEDTIITRQYYTSSIDQPFRLRNNEYINVATSSISHPWKINNTENVNVVTSSLNMLHNTVGQWYDEHELQIQMIDKYGGFKSGSLQTYISQSYPDSRYQRKIFHYDSYLPSDSYITSSWQTLNGTGIIIPDYNTTYQLNNINVDKLRIAYLFAPTTVMSQIFTAASASRYILDLYATPSVTSSVVDLTINIFNTSNPSDVKLSQTFKTRFGKRFTENNGTSSLVSQWVNRYKFDFISSGSTTIQISGSGNALLFPFATGVYDYLTPWEEGWIRNQNRDRNLYIGSTTETWYYQYNECSAVNRLRFSGCKLEGPGINIDSPFTVDGGPVVEIKQTNPNSIFINGGNSDGNLRIE